MEEHEHVTATSPPTTALDRQISLPDNDVPLVTEAPEAEPLHSKAHEDVRRMMREEDEDRRKRVLTVVGKSFKRLFART